MMSMSDNAYMEEQMLRREEEFHQIHIVPEYIFDVHADTKMTFCCPFWA